MLPLPITVILMPASNPCDARLIPVASSRNGAADSARGSQAGETAALHRHRLNICRYTPIHSTAAPQISPICSPEPTSAHKPKNAPNGSILR